MAAEQKLQAKILRYLNARPDTWAVKVITANRRGTPDILACVSGQFVALEVKAPGKAGNTSRVQQFQIEKIRETGGTAAVVCSLAQVAVVINDIREGYVV